MKKFRSTFLFVLFSFTCLLSQESMEEPSFDWLIGTFEKMNTKSAKKSFEKWWINEDGQLEGLGWTAIEQDTVFKEKLMILNRDDKWYYVAEVSHNPKPTSFELIEIMDYGFISENLAHDFPKRITYQLNGEELVATISGDGKSIPFYFKRTKGSSSE